MRECSVQRVVEMSMGPFRLNTYFVRGRWLMFDDLYEVLPYSYSCIRTNFYFCVYQISVEEEMGQN